MKRCLGVAMVVALVVVLTAGVAAAAGSHPNLAGNWTGTGNFVGWNGGFYTITIGWNFDIQNEDTTTGNFYGLENGDRPFTGNVATNKVVTIIQYDGSGNHHIFTGKVTGKKMMGTVQHFLPGSPGQIDTGTLTLIKQ